MGYLDNTSVTVDAVLTKKGRQLIANGDPLDIQHFTLSDTGVSYNLWNPDHPSGSAYYGEAIENLPQVEAGTQVQYSLRNKLLTLVKDATALPLMDLSATNMSFSTATAQSITATLLGYAAGQSTGIQVIVSDTNVVTPVNAGASHPITGNAMQFIIQQDIAQAAMYEMTNGYPHTIQFTPVTDLPSDSTTNVTIFDIATGAYNSFDVSVDGSIVPQTPLTTTPTG